VPRWSRARHAATIGSSGNGCASPRPTRGPLATSPGQFRRHYTTMSLFGNGFWAEGDFVTSVPADEHQRRRGAESSGSPGSLCGSAAALISTRRRHNIFSRPSGNLLRAVAIELRVLDAQASIPDFHIARSARIGQPGLTLPIIVTLTDLWVAPNIEAFSPSITISYQLLTTTIDEASSSAIPPRSCAIRTQQP